MKTIFLIFKYCKMKRQIYLNTICLALFFLLGSLQNNPAFYFIQNPTQKKTLFDGEDILNIKISGNLRSLLNDRVDNPTYHTLHFSYHEKDSAAVTFPIQIKTRGRFRKLAENCNYPPLLLNFAKKNQPKESIFQKQDKIKLVMPCNSDEYVLKEWLVYKIYNLFTENSFRVRLVKVELEDAQKKKANTFFYGFLLEEEKQMAARNKLIAIEKKTFRPELTEKSAFIKMAVFQYFIGNTDWSVQFLQNIKLLGKDSLSKNPIPVPYDFDHAGLVSTPYALPFEALMMKSVRERRYRGYCITDMKEFEPAIEQFNKLKPAIYKLYEDCSLIDAKYKKTCFSYFDDFYKTINDAKLLKNEFSYPCDPNGTGNVVIKGLKTD